MSFFDNTFLWLDAVIAAAISAAAMAATGVHAILRRVVFLPAALAQLAGLGVVIAFLLVAVAPSLGSLVLFNPRLFAFLFTTAGALVLGFVREPRGVSRGWLLAVVYLVSSSLILLIGGRIPQEMHDVNDLLFGNAVAVERGQMWLTVVACSGVLILQGVMSRPFILVAFDAKTSLAHGVPVRFLDAILFFTMGAAAAIATRSVGALPAFAFAVFPAATALYIARRIWTIVIAASFLGALDAFLGYWASFVFSLPTGATMAAMALLTMIVIVLVVKLGQMLRPRNH